MYIKLNSGGRESGWADRREIADNVDRVVSIVDGVIADRGNTFIHDKR